jgi:hypothetical protein
MTDRYAISVVGLRTSYGSHLVLDGIDMQIAAETVFTLLGRRRQNHRSQYSLYSHQRRCWRETGA